MNKNLFILIILLVMVNPIIRATIGYEGYGFLLVMSLSAAILAVIFISAYRDSNKPLAERLHPAKFWKMPYETTSAGLWSRAAFSAVAAFLMYAGMMSLLWIMGGLDVAFASVMGIQFPFWIPYFYWDARRRYEPAHANQTDVINPLLRHSDNPRKPSRRERWIIALGVGAIAGTLAIIGMWLT